MCTMGAGFAKQIKEHYPEAWYKDLGTIRGDAEKLGTYTHVKVLNRFVRGNSLYIINAYTQFNFTNQLKMNLSYEALNKVMIKINKDFDPAITISMPKIGCGLGGGSWKVVSTILKDIFVDREIHIYSKMRNLIDE